MNLAALSGEEKLFVGRLEDLCSGRRAAPSFSLFLTQRRISIAEAFISQRRYAEQTMLYGGFPDAERQILGVFPAHQYPDAAAFPVRAVTLHYRPDDAPTHRDFLGACLSLLITRDSIGDIVPEQGRCTIFALESVAPVILQELRKVGGVGVRCEPGAPADLEVRREFDELRGTVSSPRVDCVVALFAGISREKSAKLIQAELVQVNHANTGISKHVSPGDVISIRGRGKFIVDIIGNSTRKGRLPVNYRKYR